MSSALSISEYLQESPPPCTEENWRHGIVTESKFADADAGWSIDRSITAAHAHHDNTSHHDKTCSSATEDGVKYPESGRHMGAGSEDFGSLWPPSVVGDFSGLAMFGPMRFGGDRGDDAPLFGTKCMWVATILFGLGTLFLTVLSLCCTPWVNLGPFFALVGASLVLLLLFFVPMCDSDTTAAEWCASRCLVRRKSRVAAMSKLAALSLMVAACAAVGFSLSRDSLPSVAVNRLELTNANAGGWSVSGQVNVPWCGDMGDCVRLRSSGSTLPTASVGCDGSFTATLPDWYGATNISTVEALPVYGWKASCNGCFTYVNVEPFVISATQSQSETPVVEQTLWNRPAVYVPFVDLMQFAAYAYPVLTMLSLAAIVYAATRIYFSRPCCSACTKPRSASQHMQFM